MRMSSAKGIGAIGRARTAAWVEDGYEGGVAVCQRRDGHADLEKDVRARVALHRLALLAQIIVHAVGALVPHAGDGRRAAVIARDTAVNEAGCRPRG